MLLLIIYMFWACVGPVDPYPTTLRQVLKDEITTMWGRHHFYRMNFRPNYNYDDQVAANTLLHMAMLMMSNSDKRVARFDYHIKSQRARTLEFEVGYLYNELFMRYRKMLDIFITAKNLYKKLYTFEHLFYLEDIEHKAVEIEHISNMMYEVERKYGIGNFNFSALMEDEERRPSFYPTPKKPKMPREVGLWNLLVSTVEDLQAQPGKPVTKEPKPKWWPMEYGFEVNYWW